MPTVKGAGAEINDLRAALRALRALPKDLTAELRDRAGDIAGDLAERARSRASTPLERKVGDSIRPRRDRIPKVVAGGRAAAVGSRGATAGDVLYGGLFGGQGRATTQQFRPHLGRRGYLLYPALREHGDEMGEAWLDALETVIAKAAKRGSA